jgi:outer membrane putative beta-barrel porin/alpha-amylase
LKPKTLFSAAILLTAHILFSQTEDIISPERPGFTNPPSTVIQKHLQIESGIYYEYDKVKDTEFKTDNFLYPATLFRYGLLNNIELRLEADIAAISWAEGNIKQSESGLNPIIIGTKIYICKQKKSRPETAFMFSLTLPYFGRESFQPNYPAPGFALYFQNIINSKLSIGYNLGMQWSGNDANPVSYITFSPGFSFTKKIGGFIEAYSYFSKGAVPDFRCDAGLTYTPVKNLQFDVYGGPGISGPTKNYFISGGISLRLPG